MPVGIQETRGLASLSLSSFLDQESALVLTSKTSTAYCLSQKCTNLNCLEGKSGQKDELLPASQGFCVFFIAIFKGVKTNNWDKECVTQSLSIPVGAGAVTGFQSVCWYTNDEPSAFSMQEESSSGQNSG